MFKTIFTKGRFKDGLIFISLFDGCFLLCNTLALIKIFPALVPVPGPVTKLFRSLDFKYGWKFWRLHATKVLNKEVLS